MKVMSVPHPSNLKGESGINTVVRKYKNYLPELGVELVPPGTDSFDILHIHAGLTKNYPKDAKIVSSLHGLYWTADYDAPMWEYSANKTVIETTRAATVATVPSPWVARTLERDMHLSPIVVPHGVNIDEWRYDGEVGNYVVAYAKNRAWADVSVPTMATEMARRAINRNFVATFAQNPVPRNMKVTGVLPYQDMKSLVQKALVFVSPVKETFGIAALEAMAAGVPVLTVDAGHVPVLAPHGVCGYAYRDGDINDMIRGLEYCIANRDVLGRNAREIASGYTWQNAAKAMLGAYEVAMTARRGGVSVVIPVYNKEIKQLERAIDSVLAQTRKPERVVVVDDGSEVDRGSEYQSLCARKGVVYIRQDNKGVAHARNNGINATSTEFVCCLDADDAIEPRFLELLTQALERDNSLYIAYSKLRYVMPDGKTGVSEWPEHYDFDKFLKRRNQVPTCNVFRRVVWERLGGYRQRYAPTGAGAEDAEFWLRAGAMGYRGERVTDEPLFVYSQGSGHTSNNYQEVDWLAWHKPWLDGKHPFASLATPNNKISHPVNQYDDPLVSVIIPVGPGHEEEFVSALDSLEAQSFLKWEVIVVWDSPNPLPFWIMDAFPYVNFSIIQPETHGAGAARNRGAKLAKAPLLLFLDADDWLYPEFIERALDAWNEHESCVYTDYIGISTVEDRSKLSRKLVENMLDYNEETSRAVIYYRAAEFDCARALRQPEPRPYHWNNITTLVPKAWHEEIGGFDESMQSWEDLDYWWRIAKSGKCFVRVPEPLMVYRFDTGKRRSDGLQDYPELQRYLEEKYEGETKAMGCGCSGKTSDPATYRNQNLAGTSSMSQRSNEEMQDDNFVMVTYLSQNRGQHPVTGQSTKTVYGYRSGGERFLVHRDDVSAQPHMFRPVQDERPAVTSVPQTERPTPEKPQPISDESMKAAEEFEVAITQDEPNLKIVEQIKGYHPLDISNLDLRKEAIQSLAAAGVTTKEKAVALGMEGLQEIKWIGEATAEKILEIAKS